MRFSYYALILVYFMTGLGLLATSLVESVGPGFIAVVAAVSAFSFYIGAKGKRVISGMAWNVLAAAVLVMFLADYLFVTKSLITASSRFLTVLLALKLFDLKGTRDYMILFSIVFFQIIASAASTVSPLFLLILILFIIGAIFAMVILNIKKDWDEWAPSGSEIPRGLLDTPFFLTVVIVSVVSLATGFALFFLMPRMATGFFESKTLNTVKVTGFSEKVDLGSIGPVKTDSTVVMRVEVEERDFLRIRTAGPLYFRGTALDRYDGISWARTARELKEVRRDQTGVFVLGDERGALVKQVIYLEPLETNVLFAASRAVSVRGRFPSLRVDPSGSIFLPSTPYSRIVYTVLSRPGDIAGEASGVTGFDLETGAVDGGEAGARLTGLVNGIIKGKKTPLEKAAAIDEYLKANYKYTLSPGKGGGANPLDDFLFFTKEGYCEHYATALAVMLRLAGVPARLVTGFLQGEWNSFGNYFIVRQRDAHSWVEAYVEKAGWVKLDPTPQAGTSPYETRYRLLLYLDAFRLRWNRYIINYTFTDQQRIGLRIESQTSAFFNSIKNALRSPRSLFPRGGKGAVPYAIAFLAAALAAVIYYAIRRSARREGTAGLKTPGFYMEMLSVLEKKGFRLNIGETPLEFAVRTGAPIVLDVTRAFQEERYGGITPGPGELASIRAKIEEMKSEAFG